MLSEGVEPPMARVKVLPPSKDLLLGLSITRNVEPLVGEGVSSRTLPEDFLLWKPFGSLIGMKSVSRTVEATVDQVENVAARRYDV